MNRPALVGICLSAALIRMPGPEPPEPSFLPALYSQIFPVSVWRIVTSYNYTVLYPFSMAATGAAVANGWSAGRRWALRHWASAPESGNPWQQGTCRGARRCRCTVKGVSQTPEAPPGAPSPGGGNGKKGYGAPVAANQTGPAKRWLSGLAALIRPRRIPAKTEHRPRKPTKKADDARHQMDS